MSQGNRIFSPNIEKLKEELASGSNTALDEFWHEISISGTPLI